MRRQQAEKLLSALIFDDLDDASKTELTAYLQTDDELRERLADMRMAVKVASDTLNHGPNPVLDKRRLRQLARLSRHTGRSATVFTFRRLAVAAAILIGVMLPAVVVFNAPKFGKVRKIAQGVYPEKSYSVSEESEAFDGERAGKEVEERVAYRRTRGFDYDKDMNGGTDSPADYVSAGVRVSASGEVPAERAPSSVWRDAGVPGASQPLMGLGIDGGKSLEVGGDAEIAKRLYGGGYTVQRPETTVTEGVVAGGGSYRYGDDLSGAIALDMGSVPEVQITNGLSGGRYKGDVAAKEDADERYFDSYFNNRPAPAATPAPAGPAQMGVRHDAIVSASRRQSGVSGAQTTPDRKVPLLGDMPQIGALYKSPAIIPTKPVYVGTPQNVPVAEDAKGKITEGRDGITSRETSRPAIESDFPADIAAGTDVLLGANRVMTDSKNSVVSLSPTVPVQTTVVPPVGSKAEGDELKKTAALADLSDKSKTSDYGIIASGLKAVAPHGAASVAEEQRQLFENADRLSAVVSGSEVSDESMVKKEAAASKAKTEPPAGRPAAATASMGGIAVGQSEPELPPASRFKLVPVNQWVMTERDRQSTFALDVDTASYTLCRRYIRGGFLPPAGAVRMEEFINYFNYNYHERANPTFAVHAQAGPSPFASEGSNLTLLKIGVKARTVGRDQQKPAHLVVVVDTSASMGQPDRLPFVQQALGLLIDRLADIDRVTLITCAGEARLHMEAVPAAGRNEIKNAVNSIQSAGPTNLLAGLKLGYAVARRYFSPKQINRVVLCSDGVANVGETESEQVLKEVAEDRKQGITITCVGVGYGSYNDIFLESLANQGDGSYVFLDSMAQAQKVFVEQLAATLNTVAKDARIQVEFNPDCVRRYRLIGYENRDIEDKRFRDDTIDAGEVGSGQCSTALYELELTGPASITDSQQNLGTVFVRYRNTDTGMIEEISSPLAGSLVRRLTVETAPRFFLAAAAGRFAEILRESEHARNANLNDVASVMEKVSLALPLDRDVSELLQLVRRADGLPKAP